MRIKGLSYKRINGRTSTCIVISEKRVIIDVRYQWNRISRKNFRIGCRSGYTRPDQAKNPSRMCDPTRGSIRTRETKHLVYIDVSTGYFRICVYPQDHHELNPHTSFGMLNEWSTTLGFSEYIWLDTNILQNKNCIYITLQQFLSIVNS